MLTTREMANDLLGRDYEIEAMGRAIARGREGASAALIIVGEPGIGKTALLDHAAGNAGDMVLLRAVGIEAESEMPYATLHELLAPVLHHRQALPDAALAALEGALGMAGRPPVERFAPAIGVLLLLAEVSEREGPVLAMVDDAHWIDAASAEVLTFAARRFGADGVALLFAARPGEGREFPARGLDRISLGPLDDGNSRLLVERAGADVTPTMMSLILEYAAGNPLALLELPFWLDDVQRTGTATMTAPPAIGGALAEAFGSVLRAVPRPTQEALLLAAASRDGDLAVLTPALEAAGLKPTAFDAAVVRDIVHVGHGRITFRHPLLRSASYSSGSPAGRRRAHRSLASVLGPDSHVEERAWHLATAADGPDDAAVASLLRAAEHATARGAPGAAAAALERAAQLCSDPVTRDRYLLDAAEAFLGAGDGPNTARIADRLVTGGAHPQFDHRIAQLGGRVQVLQGRPSDGAQALAELADTIAPSAPGQASLLCTEAALACFMSADVRRAEKLAQRAVTLSAGGDELVGLAAEAALGQALTLRGDGRRVKSDNVRIAERLCEIDPIFGAMYTQVWYSLYMAEEYEPAKRLLGRAIAEARASGKVPPMAFLQACRAHLDIRLGRVESALSAADESQELAEATGQIGWLTLTTATLGWAAALTGDEAAARQCIAEAAEFATAFGTESIHAYTGTALGALELALGRPEAAIEAIEPVDAMMSRHGAVEPHAVPWAPDLIESYIRAGRLDKAKAALERFEAAGPWTAAPVWLEAAAARYRGLLAPPDDVDDKFNQAMSWHDRSPSPFERGRTDLCWGERLRRDGRRIDARARLGSAIEAFDEAGARLWAERARRELAATGLRLPARPADEPQRLTPQESRAAALVGEGATNREVAAAMFISTKTVEYHLRKIFVKLGVRSRSELAFRYGRGEDL